MEKTGTYFYILSFVILLRFVPIIKPIKIKKAVGHLPIRKRGSRSPMCTNRKYPPPMSGSILLFSCAHLKFSTFSLAQKSAKRFFSSLI